jgi:hypothetical protein
MTSWKSRFPRSLLLTSLLASAPMGCGKKDSPSEPAKTEVAEAPQPSEEKSQPRRDPEVEPGGAAKAAESPSVNDAFGTPALSVAPKTAPVFLSLRLKKLLDILGFDALKASQSDAFAALSAASLDATGKDLLDLGNFKTLGIDLERPAGLFMVDMQTEGGALFLRLSDRKAFEAALTTLAGKFGMPLKPEPLGEDVLYSLSDRDRATLLVRADMAYLVVLERGTGSAAIAKELATRKADDGLGSLPEMREAMTGLVADEGGLLLQPKLLLPAPPAPRDMSADSEKVLAQLRLDLDAARKANNTPLASEIEASIKTIEGETLRFRQRSEAEQRAFGAVTNGLSAVAVGFDASPEGFEVQANLPVGSDNGIAAATRNGEVLTVLKTLAVRPLMSFGLDIDLTKGLGILFDIASVEGEDIEKMKAEFKSSFGLDLSADLPVMFDGRTGFALTGDIDALMKEGNYEELFGFNVVLGVKDSEKVKALMGKVAEFLRDAASFDAANATLTITGEKDRKFIARIAQNALVVSTDAEAASRMSNDNSVLEAMTNTKAKDLLKQPEIAGFFEMSQMLPAMMLLRGGNWEPPTPPVGMNESAELAAKRKELSDLDKEAKQLREAVEAPRTASLFAAMQKLGTWAQTLKRTDKGLVWRFGLYPEGATLAEALAAVVQAAMNAETSRNSPEQVKLRELEDKRWNLYSEISRLQQEQENKAPTP